MPRPKGTGGAAKELTPKEIKRIDLWMANGRHALRNRTMFFVALGTGMRIGEVVGLRVADVRPHDEVLEEIVLEKHSSKTKKSRTVALNDQAREHLKTWLDSREDLDGDAPLFPSQKHPRRQMKPNYASQMLSKIFADAGVPNASSHSLRRTHINAMDKNGERIKVIQEQVGHANLSTTQRYLEVTPDERRRAVQKLKF
jgi:integrase/recombinase XerD